MIQPSDLEGVPETTARRVLATARSIAPCIATIEGEPRLDAIAILQALAADGISRGSRHVRSQRVGPAGVEYRDVGSWFSEDDKSALRALCSITGSPRDPSGSFPAASRTVSELWPEE